MNFDKHLKFRLNENSIRTSSYELATFLKDAKTLSAPPPRSRHTPTIGLTLQYYYYYYSWPSISLHPETIFLHHPITTKCKHQSNIINKQTTTATTTTKNVFFFLILANIKENITAILRDRPHLWKIFNIK